MSTPTLREAAQALLTRWDACNNWRDMHFARDEFEALRAAITQAADAGAAEPVATYLGCGHDEQQQLLSELDGLTIGTNLYAAPPAQQLQQAVARAIEKCAAICEAIEDDYQEREGHKYPELNSDAQTGARDCAAAIRQQGTP